MGEKNGYCGNHYTDLEYVAFKTQMFKSLEQVVYKLVLHI